MMTRTRKNKDDYTLSQTDPTRIVGQRGNKCRCPIATWLNETRGVPTGQDYFNVDTDNIYAYSEGKTRFLDTPPWARAFIRHTDQTVENEFIEITAGECLQILDEWVIPYHL
jgi:hypothetical protein